MRETVTTAGPSRRGGPGPCARAAAAIACLALLELPATPSSAATRQVPGTVSDSSPVAASAAAPGPVSRPVFASYKDVSIDRAPGSAALLVSHGGPSRPLAQALPAAQTSVVLAFATGECGNESWGGVAAPDFVRDALPPLVASGRRFTVSTGGQGGTFTCGSEDAFERFLARYESPAFAGVDFDIEAGQTPEDVDRLVRAARAASARHPRLAFSFTVATLGGERASALAPIGVTVMEALKRHAFDTARVNLMVMDYGPPEPAACVLGPDRRCDMGASARRAAERLHADWGVAWGRIELTPMIGGNDSVDETFTLVDVDTVVAFARERGLAALHFWSVDRDTDCPPGPASPRCNTAGRVGTWAYANRFLEALAR